MSIVTVPSAPKSLRQCCVSSGKVGLAVVGGFISSLCSVPMNVISLGWLGNVHGAEVDGPSERSHLGLFGCCYHSWTLGVLSHLVTCTQISVKRK